MLNAAHFINSFNFDKNTLLGVLARQATKNALSIFIGTISGALNTIIVLPRAFENFEEGWGLLKVLTAYALIFSQFFHGGIPSMIIRYFPKLQNEEQQKNFLGFAYLAPVIGSLALIVVFSAFGFEALQLVNDKNAGLLKENMGALLFLSATLIFFYSINGYLSAVLKTTVYQFLNETFLKSWYLIIAFAYWYDVVTFPQLMLCYIGGYALATVILLAYALRSGLRVRWGAFPLKKAELATYSLYSILDRGAGIVVNNLDIVMIGILLDLDNVAYYTLAFYIGAVTQLPQKAISAIANPLASNAINTKNNKALSDIYKQSSFNQFILGGILFVAIWVSINEVMVLLPEKFSGGKWVVFFIGLSRLFQMATGVSGGILVYSKHFRLNFRLNLILIVLTLVTNYFFIHKGYLNMDITGAAIATAITLFIYNLVKIIYVKKHFQISPFSKHYGIGCLLLLLATTVYFWEPLRSNMIAAILLKSGLVTVILLGITIKSGFFPELTKLFKRK